MRVEFDPARPQELWDLLDGLAKRGGNYSVTWMSAEPPTLHLEFPRVRRGPTGSQLITDSPMTVELRPGDVLILDESNFTFSRKM